MAFDASSFFGNASDSLHPGNLSDPFAPGGAFGIPTADTFDFAKYGIPTDANIPNFGTSSGGFPIA
ncbi:MAG: hypothetical protein V7L21_31080 [Nostoc sp.]|uniref:hypothetical protein n=1 Tax=unclassified Nostoc TaxID=2593658 RepID=UPI0025CD0E7E|nr:hypothetical protein [Nostoc sp. NMS9]MBN3944859.1 hypothetical protein [Nostoc sp. NMS9]